MAGPHREADGFNLNLKLDRFFGVKFSQDGSFASVAAGTHLGVDTEDPVPRDPDTKERQSVLYQLDQSKKALQDPGGITRQTVSGFLSTGSSGGSLMRSLHDQIRRIRLLDGQGRLRDLVRGGDEFNAAETGWTYLRERYPKWDDFMKLRAEYDPKQLFVNTYWRRHLGIPR
jgi:D-arabinono-1,4-lactone oxidase